MTSKREHTQAEMAAWLGIAANVALAALKAAIGVIAGSSALLADAVHSGSDVIGSLAVLVGLRVARKPADTDHPYGHGRAEIIAAGIVALFLFGAGGEVTYSSIRTLFGRVEPPGWMAIPVALIAIVVKEILFRYKYWLGKKLNSPSLVANAYEHRSDVFSSIAALLGITASIAGGRLGIRWLEYMDPAAGLFVGVLVLKMAYELAVESSQTLMDQAVDDQMLSKMGQVVSDTRGVCRLDEIRGREHGQYMMLDVKVSVEPLITVREGHDIARRVKKDVLEAFPQVRDVLVHVNPFDEGNGKWDGEDREP